MPDDILDVLKPKGNYIQFMEMSAAALFVATFGQDCREANVTLFCDNVAQQGSLSKGFSKDLDNAVLAGVFWDMIAAQGINLWLERVPSEENLSDVPTREDDWRSLSISLGQFRTFRLFIQLSHFILAIMILSLKFEQFRLH